MLPGFEYIERETESFKRESAAETECWMWPHMAYRAENSPSAHRVEESRGQSQAPRLLCLKSALLLFISLRLHL